MSTRRPIVVTGPTGWIGSALLATIAAERGDGWAEDVRLFGSSERPVAAPDGSVLPMRPLQQIESADVDGALVVHLAYLTKEKVGQLGATRFFETNQAIDDSLYRALAAGNPYSLFVASSGAAALVAQGRDRHLYGVMKLLQEDRFIAYGRDAGLPVLAGRIFNLAGPYINKVESYAVSSFLSQAFAERRIVIEARVPVYRAYLHVQDLARLVLATLEAGIGFERPVDLCGTEVLEMIDIATAAARLAGLDTAAIERGAIDFARPSAYLGDGTEARTLALRHGLQLAPFSRQIKDTADFLRTSTSPR